MKFRSKNQIKRKKRLPSSKLPSARQDNLHLRRSGRYVSPHRKNPKEILGIIVKTIILPFTTPFLFLEKRIVEPIAHLLDEWDLFRILEKIVTLIAIIVFIGEREYRREQRIFETSQVVKAAKDGEGSKSGVVRLALERLHKEGFSLSGINAEKASLEEIKLNKSNLNNAYLNGAYLNGACLTDADLTYAKLEGAYLVDANLSNAKFTYATFKNANLIDADLSDANLFRTNLSGADLSDTKFWDKKSGRKAKNITAKQIRQAKNWEKAVYSPEFRRQLGLPPEEE